MVVNIKQWREIIPMTQAQIQAGTIHLGSPVSVSTISKMELGVPVSRLKIQAVLNVLNPVLLERNFIEKPLQIEDIKELMIA